MAYEDIITQDDIDRSKRAVVVLMECFKAVHPKKPPLQMRQDVQALMGLIRKIENQ